MSAFQARLQHEYLSLSCDLSRFPLVHIHTNTHTLPHYNAARLSGRTEANGWQENHSVIHSTSFSVDYMVEREHMND